MSFALELGCRGYLHAESFSDELLYADAADCASVPDMHFSQGDGEVSFCGAIEMSGFLELK